MKRIRAVNVAAGVRGTKFYVQTDGYTTDVHVARGELELKSVYSHAPILVKEGDVAPAVNKEKPYIVTEEEDKSRILQEIKEDFINGSDTKEYDYNEGNEDKLRQVYFVNRDSEKQIWESRQKNNTQEEDTISSGLNPNIKVGNIVHFGHYEQDGNENNGKEPIEWKVLEKKGNKALLISKKVLDEQPYNKERVDITWEQCTLRKWLNQEFLQEAFQSQERRVIQNSKMVNLCCLYESLLSI